MQEFLLSADETESLVINRDDIILKEKVVIGTDMFGEYPQKPIRVGIVNKGGKCAESYYKRTISNTNQNKGLKNFKTKPIHNRPRPYIFAFWP